jgi:GntP family gluconate:H+ symporter
MLSPLLVLAIGIGVVLVMLLVFRLNAFLGLITAAFVVGFLSEEVQIIRPAATLVAEEFGKTAASIGIAIGLAAIIGSCLVASGAADRIVEMFLAIFGEKRGAGALAASGFLLAVPVFFDTVFYLLFPLARSMYQRTGKHFVRYLLAIGAGSAVTHTMVPPTPGPLLMADTIGVDVGLLMLVGGVVSIPMTLTGLAFAAWRDRRMTRTILFDDLASQQSAENRPRPGLALSLLPIVLPVTMIASGPVVGAFIDPLPPVMQVLADKNVALLAATFVALAVYWIVVRPTRHDSTKLVEESVLSAGIIVLITAAGGAFGGMLKHAGVGPAIESLLGSDAPLSGFATLWLAFAMTSLIKCAQGSTTVAIITGSSMVAAMIADQQLALHPVYLCTAIGSGAMITSWLNDSGFWLYCRMGHLTEEEGLTTWVPLTSLMGVAGMATTLLLATLWPGV